MFFFHVCHVACELQVISLILAFRHLYWLYDRFIMEDEHRANEVRTLSFPCCVVAACAAAKSCQLQSACRCNLRPLVAP
jgi:hypothetical protein